MYDTIVAEVERDYVHVFEHELGAVPIEDEDEGFVQYELFNGLHLDSSTTAFSNFTVRDALMAKANADDKFAFVLAIRLSIPLRKRVRQVISFRQTLTRSLPLSTFRLCGNKPRRQ